MGVLKKYHHIATDNSVDEHDGELSVWLKYGYAFEPNENPRMARHTETFDSWKDLNSALKFVEKCPCSECGARLGQEIMKIN